MSAPVDVLAVASGTAIAIDAGNHLAKSLQLIGWELLSVEIDLTVEAARIELRSGDRYVMFDARNGRASITTERMTVERRQTGRRGDITVCNTVRPEFMGRQTGFGLRSGIRALSHYVGDNAPSAIPHDKARDLFRPLLGGNALARVKSGAA